MSHFFEKNQVTNSEVSIAYDIIDYIQDITNGQFAGFVTQYVLFKKNERIKMEMLSLEKGSILKFEKYVGTLTRKFSEKCMLWKGKLNKSRTRKKTATILFTKWFQQLNNTKFSVQSFPLIKNNAVISEIRGTDARKYIAKVYQDRLRNVMARCFIYNNRINPGDLGEIKGKRLKYIKETHSFWKMPDESQDHVVHIHTPKILELDLKKRTLSSKQELTVCFPAIATVYP